MPDEVPDRIPPLSNPSKPYPSDDSDDPDDPDNLRKEARTQILVQDIHTSPDDSNAVLGSGAMMMTTAPDAYL